MLVATIRPTESRTVTVEGQDIPTLRADLEAQTPAGWMLVDAPVAMKPGGLRIIEARYERRDGSREIEADDMDGLTAKVPDGWRMLSVRRP